MIDSILNFFRSNFTVDLHDPKVCIGLLAGAIQLGTLFPYLRRLLKSAHPDTPLEERSRPSIVTWAIWSLLCTAALIAFLRQSKHHEAMWVPVMSAVNSISVLGVALWVGEFQPMKTTDIWALVAAAIAGSILILRPDAEDPTALWVAIAGDTPAVIYQIRYVRKDPWSEPFWPWTICAGGMCLNLVVLDTSSVSAAAYPLYIALSCVGIAAAIGVSQSKARKRALQLAS